MIYIFVYYAPNFEEVWEAYWFGPVRPSVRMCVTLALGQEPLKSRNLVCRMSMKIKRPVLFSLSIGFVIAELLPFSFFLHYKHMEAYKTKYHKNRLSQCHDIWIKDCV